MVIVMSVVETLKRNSSYRTLRIHNENDARTSWCHMHARAPNDSRRRPCFSLDLLEDLRALQADVRAGALPSAGQLGHLVLASDSEVFNLGGDLELFCRLIRCRDRAALFDYARRCIEVAYGFHNLMGEPGVHTIALLQGDALGGGFEAALCCNTIVAEQGIGMGFPEVLFDLFPGMGAYTFLCRRVSASQAERMMLDGRVYTSDELFRLGIVDHLVPKGEGESAVRDVIRRHQRIGNARLAMDRVRDLARPVSLDQLLSVTGVWVDAAMQLSDRALGTMERLVRAQKKRFVDVDAPALMLDQRLTG